MSEVMIKPLRSYEDGGQVRNAKSKPYPASLRHAKQLEARGLCRIIEDETPKQSAGESPSASPAAQASPLKTAGESVSGETPRRRGRPSARTPHSD
jgi:hypothetical protein